MDNNIIQETSKPIDEPIVIPDECGDSMWDKVLEQADFAQAVRLAPKADPDIKLQP